MEQKIQSNRIPTNMDRRPATIRYDPCILPGNHRGKQRLTGEEGFKVPDGDVTEVGPGLRGEDRDVTTTPTPLPLHMTSNG
jgi:hypothetical protein